MKNSRPNILLIIPHDLGDFLHCYGHETVQSPNIDALAAGGVRFTDCFTTSPECTPSRGGLYTGLYPHQNGLMGLSNFGWSLRVPHLAERLRDGGYDTHLFGTHHETSGPIESLGYQHTHSQENRHVDVVCETLADFVRSPATCDSAPWFACAGFHHVHRAWPTETSFDADDMVVPPFLPDNPVVRKDLAQFHESILEMDTAVGRVLDALNSTEAGRNTLVIFTTDHGAGFPRAKATLYDPGLRVPLIMRYPGRWDNGTVHNCLLSNLDVAPTLLELAGIPLPDELEGRSFLPLLDRQTYTERDAVFGDLLYDVAYDPMHYVRTRTHKYIRSFAVTPEEAEGADPRVLATFAGGEYIRVDDFDVMSSPAWQSMAKDYPKPLPEELYDLVNDPWEQQNLATENAAPLSELRERLHDFMERTQSPLLHGHVPPPPEQVEANRKYRPGGPMYDRK